MLSKKLSLISVGARDRVFRRERDSRLALSTMFGLGSLPLLAVHNAQAIQPVLGTKPLRKAI